MEIGTYPLEKTSIFQGADAQQVQKMLGVILPSIKTYVRGETICRAGEMVSSLGIVLAGGATIELCDAWGNRSIIERLEPGEGFAEAYAWRAADGLRHGGRAHARDVSGRQPHAVDGA